jgi:hypothetical protein
MVAHDLVSVTHSSITISPYYPTTALVFAFLAFSSPFDGAHFVIIYLSFDGSLTLSTVSPGILIPRIFPRLPGSASL